MKQIPIHILVFFHIFSAAACFGNEQLPGRTVFFDEGHGQRFFMQDKGNFGISGLAGMFSDHGFTVITHSAALDGQILKDTDILVISGPFAPYSPDEISAIHKFLSEEGNLCLILHIGPPVNGLLHQLGIDLASGVVHENENVIQDNSLYFRAADLSSHPLTENLQHISFYGAWGFMSPMEDQRVLARTSPHAWFNLDRNGRVDPQTEFYPYGLIIVGIIGKDHFAVFSDDAIFQNIFLQNDNSILAENLVQWLSR